MDNSQYGRRKQAPKPSFPKERKKCFRCKWTVARTYYIHAYGIVLCPTCRSVLHLLNGKSANEAL